MVAGRAPPGAPGRAAPRREPSSSRCARGLPVRRLSRREARAERLRAQRREPRLQRRRHVVRRRQVVAGVRVVARLQRRQVEVGVQRREVVVVGCNNGAIASCNVNVVNF